MTVVVDTLSPFAYLTRERKNSIKSEYFNGQVHPMAGATEKHNLLVANVMGEFYVQLRHGPCRFYPSDMRVKTGDAYAYPDVIVVCGTPEFDDQQKDTLLNPTVIVEVLSSSTESYDRGKKFQKYREIKSLQEYLSVSQDEFRIEQFVRQSDAQWVLTDIKGAEASVHLSSVDCTLLLADIYARVEIEEL